MFRTWVIQKIIEKITILNVKMNGGETPNQVQTPNKGNHRKEKERERTWKGCFICIKLNGRDLHKIRHEFHLWYQKHAIWALYSQTLYKWILAAIIPTESPISTCYHIAKFAPWDFSLYKLPTFTQKLGARITYGEECQISKSI